METALALQVETIKKHTETLLRCGKVTWPSARKGVLQMLDDLVARHPEHCCKIRSKLEPWIEMQDRIYGARETPSDTEVSGD